MVNIELEGHGLESFIGGRRSLCHRFHSAIVSSVEGFYHLLANNRNRIPVRTAENMATRSP